MILKLTLGTGALALLVSWCVVPTLHAAPFVAGPAPTLTEEMAEMDVVAFVKMDHTPAHNPKSEESARGRFEVIGILKGETAIKVGQKVELEYYGEGKFGDSFFVFGEKPPEIKWATAFRITPREMNYMRKLTTFQQDSPERMQFFLQHLADEDELSSRDAFDELVRLDYAKIKALKPHLKHDQIVANIKNDATSASYRRLCFSLLSVCGSEMDLPLLESYLRPTDRASRRSLDAAISCYLTLKGESGMASIEDRFLRNKEADYADTYCAIIALRFHVKEAGVIKRERLVQAMRLMLKRPDLADLAIPDLAAWEDWESCEQIFELFKTADVKSTWLRVPAVNYLRLCPTPRAKELLVECEKIDANAVKRAKMFFPDAR